MTKATRPPALAIPVVLAIGIGLLLDTGALMAQSKAPAQKKLIPDLDLEACLRNPPDEPITVAKFEPYCKAVYDELRQKRANREAEEVKKVIAELEARTIVLEQRIETLKEWVAKRDAFKALAQDSIVRVYSRMPPESAASQMIAMPDDVAAAIVMKLDAKLSGAILAEMDAAKASRLMSLIAVAGEVSSAAKTAPAKAAK
jgi:flagellar motility protein MotE (MotC chaperone)